MNLPKLIAESRSLNELLSKLPLVDSYLLVRRVSAGLTLEPRSNDIDVHNIPCDAEYVFFPERDYGDLDIPIEIKEMAHSQMSK